VFPHGRRHPKRIKWVRDNPESSRWRLREARLAPRRQEEQPATFIVWTNAVRPDLGRGGTARGKRCLEGIGKAKAAKDLRDRRGPDGQAGALKTFRKRRGCGK
jgi:hypothetical protein